MKKPGFIGLASSAFAWTLAGCAAVFAPDSRVQLEVAGPVIDAAQTTRSDRYQVPRATGNAWDASMLAQGWAMLGREDRAAASENHEYRPAECEPVADGPSGWDAVVDAIAARAANHRIVIINESHVVSRHRETTRRLLAKLRPLGFSVLAAETFAHLPDGKSPVEQLPALAWPHQNDGYYLGEPAFGRLVRQARALDYRLAPYEVIYDRSGPPSGDVIERIAHRESAQARHLAEILRKMGPDERLLVHVGYSHASEVPLPEAGGKESEWMAARLKALTGIDPLTISQTSCRQPNGPVRLATPPASVRLGQFDMIVAHPVEAFADHRPRWRREAGDIPVAVPPALRPTDAPLVIEAFAWDEPFEAVPADRVYVEPAEDLPLLLPPGRYRVRAVRAVEP